MKSRAAESLLRAVRRRLRLHRAADALRFAAWTTVALALIAILLHLFVRPVGLSAAAFAIALCWLGALAQAAATRIDAKDCAAWADRHLGGSTAYATYLEFLDAPSPGETPALRRLNDWVEQVAPRSLEQLHAMPRRAGLSKPAAVAAVAVALTVVLLQLPAHPHVAIPPQSRNGPAIDRPELPIRPAAEGDSRAAAAPAISRAERSDRNAAPGTAGSDGITALATDRPSSAEVSDRAVGAQKAVVAHEPASGGRNAGESPDSAPDTGLSDAWQGEMAASLQALADPAQGRTRTDSTLAAEFRDRSGASPPASPASIAVAAASPPEARFTAKLTPAEQAYVRAYFAGSGVEP
jgi:hypothetical protein